MAIKFIENKFKFIEEQEKKISEYYNFKTKTKNKHVWANELKEKLPKEFVLWNNPYMDIRHELYFKKTDNRIKTENNSNIIKNNKFNYSSNKKKLFWKHKNIYNSFKNNKNNKISLVNDILNYSNYNNEIKFWHKNCKNFINSSKYNMLALKANIEQNQNKLDIKNNEIKKIEKNLKKCINKSSAIIKNKSSFKIKDFSLKNVNSWNKISLGNKIFSNTLKELSIDENIKVISNKKLIIFEKELNKEIEKIKKNKKILNILARDSINKNLLKFETNINYYNKNPSLYENGLVNLFSKKIKTLYFKLTDIKENYIYNFKISMNKNNKIIINENKNSLILNLYELFIKLKTKYTYIIFLEILDDKGSLIDFRFFNLGNPFWYNINKLYYKLVRFFIFIFGFNPNKFSKKTIENNKNLINFSNLKIILELNKKELQSFTWSELFKSQKIILNIRRKKK